MIYGCNKRVNARGVSKFIYRDCHTFIVCCKTNLHSIYIYEESFILSFCAWVGSLVLVWWILYVKKKKLEFFSMVDSSHRNIWDELFRQRYAIIAVCGQNVFILTLDGARPSFDVSHRILRLCRVSRPGRQFTSFRVTLSLFFFLLALQLSWVMAVSPNMWPRNNSPSEPTSR